MKTSTIAASLVLAAAGVLPAVAVAKHGADDGVGTTSTTASTTTVDDNAHADDNPTSSKGGNSKAKRVAGSCTGNSSSKLKVKPDDSRLETEFEVDQNRNGVTWKVVIRRNGTAVVRKNALTKAPSGSFSFERKLKAASGDKITARATSPSGEVCTASVTA